MKLPQSLDQIVSAKTLPVGRLVLAGGTLLIGQWVLSDVMHIPGGGVGILAAGAGVLWISRGSASPSFQAPESLDAWIERCHQVLDQFETFEGDASSAAEQRREALAEVVNRSGPQRLAVAFSEANGIPEVSELETALTGTGMLTLSMARPLMPQQGIRRWPEGLQKEDVILYGLHAPLMAEDLLWLQQLPDDQPAWLLVRGLTNSDDARDGLLAQLPERWKGHLLIGRDNTSLRTTLQPLRQSLTSVARTQNQTRRRLLSDLHRGWQADLERLRREKFRALQQRTQWIVASSVLASPVPSIDLLALAVANGLMIKEMGEIWGCEVKLDVLREAAAQLARTALAQGVVEWSSQVLLGLAKLDGGSWLAAGALQALSAAYLTRVVGRSMADWLALHAGVDAPDLAALKREAPVLVARAAEEERLNWNSFLDQSRHWLIRSAI